MSVRHPLNTAILTARRLMSPGEGSTVLDLLCDAYPDLAPEKYGRYEPVRTPFDCADREAVAADWPPVFLWSRTRPRVEGMADALWMRELTHDSIAIWAELRQVDSNELARFVREACSRLDGHFAFVHYLTDAELRRGGAPRTLVSTRQVTGGSYVCVVSRHLQKYIPDLYWATVFGGPYVEHFGREKLLSVPAPIVEELPGGAVYIQISDTPFDLITDFERLEGIRRAVKRHLDNDSFWDPSLPEDHVYNVPDFKLPPPPPREEIEWTIRAPRPTIKAGYIMRIPLRDGRYAYARCLYENEGRGALLQVMDRITPDERGPEVLEGATPRFPPVFVRADNAVRREKWKRIGKAPVEGFQMPAFLNARVDMPGTVTGWDLWRGDDASTADLGRRVPPQYRGLEVLITWPADEVEERIRTRGLPALAQAFLREA